MELINCYPKVLVENSDFEAHGKYGNGVPLKSGAMQTEVVVIQVS
jgi:hypothetical protein